MRKIPLTILNGFLGAGKTTLLKSLLVQASKQRLPVCVIVNDMSELDVDGVLISNTEVVSASQHNFTSISADSISSPDGIKKLDSALQAMLAVARPALFLLETSGSSHPLPLIRYFRDHPDIQLTGVLALVDAVMLNNDFHAGETLIPRLENNLRQGKRNIENLLAEQIMFCSQLLLTKHDRLDSATVTRVAQAIHPLNPYVPVSAVPWGSMDLGTILNLPEYDFHRVALLINELAPIVDVPAREQQNAWSMNALVINDNRPFHPQRLWDTCHRFMGMSIYRSKGFFWLPGRADLALLWNQTAGSISLEVVSYWKAGVLESADNGLTAEEIATLRHQVEQSPGRFGDRHCRLTIIGEKREAEAFTAELQACFLTEAEIAWWQAGGVFEDPWPQRMARLV